MITSRMLRFKWGEGMVSELEIRERHRNHLGALLKLKKWNPDITIEGLQQLIIDAVGVMDQEDIAWVEKVHEVKAL